MNVIIHRCLLVGLVAVSAMSLANEPVKKHGANETHGFGGDVSPRNRCEDLGFVNSIKQEVLDLFGESSRSAKCEGNDSKLNAQLELSDGKYFSIVVSDADFRKQSGVDYRTFEEASLLNENHSITSGSAVFVDGFSREKTVIDLQTVQGYSTIESN